MSQSRNEKSKIIVSKNGPYLVSGSVPLKRESIGGDENGDSCEWCIEGEYEFKKEYSLCRCGQSRNKPYCDGSHIRTDFIGTETATMKPYKEQCKTISGPELELDDAIELCSSARFCHSVDNNIWDNTKNSDDQKLKETAIKQACNCPSGRLVIRDKKTGKEVEPELEQCVCATHDKPKNVGGPLRVKGGIEIELYNGKRYEKRNRVTLCRCGKSKNKPFCDGMHIETKFDDGNL